MGSIIHPNGNIAEALLREGLAKCVEWQLGVVTGGGEKYRKAQEVAKDAKKRIWKNYDGPSGIYLYQHIFLQFHEKKVIERKY